MDTQMDDATEETAGWTPRLVVPEELTPLPRVELALPVLGMFGALLGRRHERFKVAILSELAGRPRGRWKIRQIHEAVSWMEPRSVTRLVGDLRMAGLLILDSSSDTYRLSTETRVIAAVCAALTVPEVGPRRIIRVLSATISMAEAAGAEDSAIYGPYLSCIAILDADQVQLRRLIDDRSEEALVEAAELARIHVEHMEDLLDEQAETFARFHSDPDFLDHDQRAHTLIASVGRLAAEVVAALSERADTLMRGGLRFDRQDLRTAVARSDLDELAGLIGRVGLPPMVPPVDPDVAFTALGDYLDRPNRIPEGLPDPLPPDIESPPPPHPDLVDVLTSRLEEAVLRDGGGPLTPLIVDGTWGAAVGRLSAVVEAWSRHGPAGSDQADFELAPSDMLEWIGHDEVGRLSQTMIEPKETE